jgi:hypothetical protein
VHVGPSCVFATRMQVFNALLERAAGQMGNIDDADLCSIIESVGKMGQPLPPAFTEQVCNTRTIISCTLYNWVTLPQTLKCLHQSTGGRGAATAAYHPLDNDPASSYLPHRL